MRPRFPSDHGFGPPNFQQSPAPFRGYPPHFRGRGGRGAFFNPHFQPRGNYFLRAPRGFCGRPPWRPPFRGGFAPRGPPPFLSRRGCHGSERGEPRFCFGDSANIQDGVPREHFDGRTCSRALDTSATIYPHRRQTQEGFPDKYEAATSPKRLPLVSKRALSPTTSDWNESHHPPKRQTQHETVAYKQTQNDFGEENRRLSSGQSTDKFRAKTADGSREKVEVKFEAKTASKLSTSPRRHDDTLNKESNTRRDLASSGALQIKDSVKSAHCGSELKNLATDKCSLKSVVVVCAKQASIYKQTTDVMSASSGKKIETICSHRPARKDCPRSSLLLEKNKSRLHSTSNTTKARESQLSSDKGNRVEPVCSAKRGTVQRGASSVQAFSRQTTSPDSTTYPGSRQHSSGGKYSLLKDTGDAEESRRAALYISVSPPRQTANRVLYQQDDVDEQVICGDACSGSRDRDQRSNVSSSTLSLDLDIAPKTEPSREDLNITLQSPPTPLRDEGTKRLNTDSPRLFATRDSAKCMFSSRPDVNAVVAQWLQMSASGKSGEGSVGEKLDKVREALQSSSAPVIIESCSDVPVLEASLPAASTGNCDWDQDTVSLSSEDSYDNLIFVSETFAPDRGAKETFVGSACHLSNLPTTQCQGAPPPELPIGAILSGTAGVREAVLFELHTYTMLSVLDFCRDPGAKQHVLSLFRQGNRTNTREACAQEMYRLVRATVERRRIMWKGGTRGLRKLSQLRWTLQPTESVLLPRIQEMCDLENVRDVHDTAKPRL